MPTNNMQTHMMLWNWPLPEIWLLPPELEVLPAGHVMICEVKLSIVATGWGIALKQLRHDNCLGQWACCSSWP